MTTGCDTMDILWEVAKSCNIQRPGIDGTGGRVVNFVQCGNVRDFMSMAMMQCWHEKNKNAAPTVTVPIFLTDTKVKHSSSDSSSVSKSDSSKSK